MKYDFDKIHKRTGTNSIKWDFVSRNGALQTRKLGVDPLASNELLPMWVADMDFLTAQPIIDALTKRASQGIFGYTRPTQSYYDAIINWMEQRTGWQAQPEWILTTPGVMPAINMAIQTFSEPGDHIIVQTPVFNPFFRAVEGNRRIVANNRLLFEDGCTEQSQSGRYTIDFDDLETKSANPRAKMIIFCSPHNPVGRVWSQDELQRLGAICQKNDIIIVSDEIHGNLVYSWANFIPFGKVNESFNDRLILCNAPSKTFNLPGLQTANVFIPNRALRDQFLATLGNMDFLFGFSAFGTLALQTAYDQGAEWLEQVMAYIEANFGYLKEYLAKYLPQLQIVQPEALYLIWIDCRALGLNSNELHRLFFEDANIYLENGRTYGEDGEGFMRMNIACPRTILAEALNRIQHVLNSAGII
ncbi:MAG: pyridoxal phosphate-dependent aminotransferase [Chloroflexi bacterium]|nr:pyridoxal phosphate-dependent aminotransferase [Chloroflexota bacterium]